MISSQSTTKTTYILWAIAGIALFALITIFGFKIFYGFVVPQAQAVSQLGIFIVLGFAFIAGLAAFFSPCPFAVFPAYIAYYLNTETETHGNTVNEKKIKLRHAIKIGSIVSLGIFSFYLVVGVILALFGTALASYTNWLKLAIIPLFFIFGIMLVAGKSFGTKKLDTLTGIVAERAKGGRHFRNMYLYGVVYGIAAAACHLPILLILALVPILAGNVITGFATFVVYALGASILLVVFTVLASRKKKFLIDNLGLYGTRIKRVFGVIFILTGIYLVGFYILFGM